MELSLYSLSRTFKPSRTTLAQKIAERNTGMVKRHIKVAEDINPNDARFIEENKETLAKFARRNNVQLSFNKGAGLFDDATRMDVKKNHYFWHFYENARLPKFYSDYVKKGEYMIFPDAQAPRKTVSEMKDAVNGILRTHKNDSDISVVTHGNVRKSKIKEYINLDD